MKYKLIFIILLQALLFSKISYSQLVPMDKIYLEFVNIDSEVNVNGNNALDMLEDYIKNKTSLIITDKKNESKYIFKLSVIEKNMGNRKGHLIIESSDNGNKIFESKWVTGTMNAFYGYSGSRHAIGILVKKQLLKEYSNLTKQD